MKTCFCGETIYCEDLCLWCYRTKYPEPIEIVEISQREEDIRDNPREL